MPPSNAFVVVTSLLLHSALGLAAPSSQLASRDITRAKDLAVVLPALGHAKIAADEALFPAPWWQAIFDAFHQTSVGDALETENKLKDWRLVAMRFAPCQPLLPFVTPRNARLCQPELRLVWQPITQHFVRDRWQAHADDRAFHALYRFEPEAGLDKDQALRWQELHDRAEHLQAAEELEFERLNRQLVDVLVTKLQQLRGSSPVSLYDDLGERPEFSQQESTADFL